MWRELISSQRPRRRKANRREALVDDGQALRDRTIFEKWLRWRDSVFHSLASRSLAAEPPRFLASTAYAVARCRRLRMGRLRHQSESSLLVPHFEHS